jgi:hypothetical protein
MRIAQNEGKGMNDLTELKVNLGMVLRGDVVVLKELMADLDRLLSKRPEVQIVHKHVSASKLWIREGDGMNENEANGP